MARATWNGVTIAESASYELVEGNVYFPRAAVNPTFLKPSDTNTVCPWKGQAHYYTLDVNGAENRDAAWFYPEPKPAAANIKDHIAFWRGVTVEH
jgi:uncharacterized protein (DUF427 family)